MIKKTEKKKLKMTLKSCSEEQFELNSSFGLPATSQTIISPICIFFLFFTDDSKVKVESSNVCHVWFFPCSYDLYVNRRIFFIGLHNMITLSSEISYGDAPSRFHFSCNKLNLCYGCIYYLNSHVWIINAVRSFE